MIFLPSLSFLINGLIIFIAKIFRREFDLRNNRLTTKIFAYEIIIMISCLTFFSFAFLIKLSVKSDSNVAILAAVSKNWHLSEKAYAHTPVSENEVPSPVINTPGDKIHLIDCQANICINPFSLQSINYFDSSIPHLTYFKALMEK